MKGLARSYVWWPGIDNDIESLARKWQCQRVQFEAPTVPLYPWEWPVKTWQRIHVDYAGPFMGWMFLIAVDAHSKWPEVLPTTSASAERTVELLRDVFARYGLPEHLHSDNGSQFTSEVFRNSKKANNIRHTFSAPHHPATNGQVERFVQTFKQAIRSPRGDSGAVKRHLTKFMFAYRNAPHATTGDSPAMLPMGRGLRTRLDVKRPNTRKTVEIIRPRQMRRGEGNTVLVLEVGDRIAVRNYRNVQKWVPGTTKEKRGTRSYEVLVEEGAIWQRHSD